MTYNCRTFPKTFALDEKTGIKFVFDEADDSFMLYYYDCMFPAGYDQSLFDIGNAVSIVDEENRIKVKGTVDSYYLQSADHIEKKDEARSSVCFRCTIKVESVTQL